MTEAKLAIEHRLTRLEVMVAGLYVLYVGMHLLSDAQAHGIRIP